MTTDDLAIIGIGFFTLILALIWIGLAVAFLAILIAEGISVLEKNNKQLKSKRGL